MIKIKKIFIKNFKGVKEKAIINLDDKATLLIGPNGFGKTTIFDVLEWIFTGKLHRVEMNEKVTNDTNDYLKPFFQNIKDEDVIIKIWLNNGTDDLILVKYFDKNSKGTSIPGGRKYKPGDYELLKLYQMSPENFEEENPKLFKEINQNTINEFCEFGKSGAKIEDVYKIFNYLQQEETTYFLKYSENERKNQLGFLFKTSEEEAKLRKIKENLIKIKKIEIKLQDKIDKIEKKELQKNENFYKLLEEENVQWDIEKPYTALSLSDAKERLDEDTKTLDNLKGFIENFSPQDYENKKIIDKLNSILNSTNMLKAIILRNEFSNFEKDKKQHELYNDDDLLKAFILEEVYNNIEEYKVRNRKIELNEKLIEKTDFRKQIELIKENKKEILDEGKQKDLEIKLEELELLTNSSTEISKLIRNIIHSREEIKKGYTASKEKADNCPYCGYVWGTVEKLETSYDNTTKELKKLKDEKAPKIEKVEKYIKDEIIAPLVKEIILFNKSNKKIDESLLEEVEKRREKYSKLQELKDIFELQTYKSEKQKATNKIQIDDLREKLKLKLRLKPEVYNEIKELLHVQVNESVAFLEQKVFFVKKIPCFEIDQNLIVQVGSLKNEVEKIKETIKYSEKAILDENHFYLDYFDSKKEKIEKINKKLIEKKKTYLQAEYNLKSNKQLELLEERKYKIDTIIKNLTKLNKTYDNVITKYKKEMITAIKIPFFLYTARMLQNYQQGMGIFIHTEKSDKIRFLTDSTSDHDAIHHLSSGQLSVVALAFCLAVNKAYKISNKLKFLAIDDPIQEMDALNIDSFVELIRNDFLEEYQIIFSTHSDTSAYYMKYKFEKFNSKSTKLINVQNEFFTVNK